MKVHPVLKSRILYENFLWLLWGIFYALSFPTYNLSASIWFIFAPVLAYSYIMPINKTVRFSFFYSIPFFILAYYWLYGFWVPALFVIIPLFAVYHAFFFFLIAYIGKKLKSVRWLIVPMIWISSELLRSIGFHGFQWNLIGDSQWHNTIMIQSADIFGVWGVSFLVLISNSVLAEIICSAVETRSLKRCFHRNNGLKIAVVFAVLVANLVYGFISYNKYERISINSPKEKLALIQPNIGSHDPWWEKHWDYYGIIWKLNAEAALKNPDMIVWSETMVRNLVWYYLENYNSDTDVNIFNIRFIKMPQEFGIPILFTSPDQIDDKYYNAADYLDPLTNIRQNNSKIHLVPFGEWMPVYDSVPVLRKLMDIEGAGSFFPSAKFNIIQERKAKIRVLICFEDIYSILARKFIKKGVNYFINTTNDGWAYKLGFPHPMWQHLAGATLTAVSVRRPIARAANTGVTGIIDATGGFKGNIGNYVRGFYIGDISIIDEKIETVFVKYGFAFPYAILFITLLVFIYAVFFCKRLEKIELIKKDNRMKL